MILHYRIEFSSFWHTGSGLGRGSDLDAIVARDELGLPKVSGRTLKGLWRDAGRMVARYGNQAAGMESLFGQEDAGQGSLIFTDARVDDQTRDWLSRATRQTREDSVRQLFRRIAATKLNKGVADAETLRTREVTVPLCLHAVIDGPDDRSWVAFVETAGKLFRKAGVGRHRGLGRCRIVFEKESTQ